MKINPHEWKHLLQQEARRLAFFLDDATLELFYVFVSELMDANTRFNLTAITDPQEIIYKHILDSLMPSKFIPHHATVLDIGTGGGFPGIPLKLYDPSLKLVLLDSSRKKINFIRFLIIKLKLKGVDAVQARVENFFPTQKADVVISRAVTSLSKLIQFAWPLITEQGMIISMKGIEKTVDTQVHQFKSQNHSILGIHHKNNIHIRTIPYKISPQDVQRYLVIVSHPNSDKTDSDIILS